MQGESFLLSRLERDLRKYRENRMEHGGVLSPAVGSSPGTHGLTTN